MCSTVIQSEHAFKQNTSGFCQLLLLNESQKQTRCVLNCRVKKRISSNVKPKTKVFDT